MLAVIIKSFTDENIGKLVDVSQIDKEKDGCFVYEINDPDARGTFRLSKLKIIEETNRNYLPILKRW